MLNKIKRLLPKLISVLAVILLLVPMLVVSASPTTEGHTSGAATSKAGDYDGGVGVGAGTVRHKVGLSVLAPDGGANITGAPGSDAWMQQIHDYAQDHYVGCDGNAYYNGATMGTLRGNMCYKASGYLADVCSQLDGGTGNIPPSEMPQMIASVRENATANGDSQTLALLERYERQQNGEEDATNPVVFVVEVTADTYWSSQKAAQGSCSDFCVKCGGSYEQLRSSASTLSGLAGSNASWTSTTDAAIASLAGYASGTPNADSMPYRWTKKFFSTIWSSRPHSSGSRSGAWNAYASWETPNETQSTSPMPGQPNGYGILYISGTSTEPIHWDEMPKGAYRWNLSALDPSTGEHFQDKGVSIEPTVKIINDNSYVNFDLKQNNYSEWAAYCQQHPGATFTLTTRVNVLQGADFTTDVTKRKSSDSSNGKYVKLLQPSKLGDGQVGPTNSKDDLIIGGYSKSVTIDSSTLLQMFNGGTDFPTSTYTIPTKFVNGIFQYSVATEMFLTCGGKKRYLQNGQIHFARYDTSLGNTYSYVTELAAHTEVKSNSAGQYGSASGYGTAVDNQAKNSAGLVGDHSNGVYNTMSGIPTTSDVYVAQGDTVWLVQLQYVYVTGDYKHTIKMYAKDNHTHNYLYYQAKLGSQPRMATNGKSDTKTTTASAPHNAKDPGLKSAYIKTLTAVRDQARKNALDVVDTLEIKTWWGEAPWTVKSNYKLKCNENEARSKLKSAIMSATGNIHGGSRTIVLMSANPIETDGRRYYKFKVTYSVDDEWQDGPPVEKPYMDNTVVPPKQRTHIASWTQSYTANNGIVTIEFEDGEAFSQKYVESSVTGTQTYQDITYLDIIECSLANVSGGQEDGVQAHLANSAGIINMAVKALGYKYYNCESTSMTAQYQAPNARNGATDKNKLKESEVQAESAWHGGKNTKFSWKFTGNNLVSLKRACKELTKADLLKNLSRGVAQQSDVNIKTCDNADSVEVEVDCSNFGGRSYYTVDHAISYVYTSMFYDQQARLAVADDILQVNSPSGGIVNFCGGLGLNTNDYVNLTGNCKVAPQYVMGGTQAANKSWANKFKSWRWKRANNSKNLNPKLKVSSKVSSSTSTWTLPLRKFETYRKNRNVVALAQKGGGNTFYKSGIGSNNVEQELKYIANGPMYTGFRGYSESSYAPKGIAANGSLNVSQAVIQKSKTTLFPGGHTSGSFPKDKYKAGTGAVRDSASTYDSISALYPNAVNLNLTRTLVNGVKESGDAAVYYNVNFEDDLSSRVQSSSVTTSLVCRKQMDTRNAQIALKFALQANEIGIFAPYLQNGSNIPAASPKSGGLGVRQAPNDIITYVPVGIGASRIVTPSKYMSDGQGNDLESDLSVTSESDQKLMSAIRDQRVNSARIYDLEGNESVIDLSASTDPLSANEVLVDQYTKKMAVTNSYVYNDYDLVQGAPSDIDTIGSGDVYSIEQSADTTVAENGVMIRASLFGNDSAVAKNIAFRANQSDKFMLYNNALWRVAKDTKFYMQDLIDGGSSIGTNGISFTSKDNNIVVTPGSGEPTGYLVDEIAEEATYEEIADETTKTHAVWIKTGELSSQNQTQIKYVSIDDFSTELPYTEDAFDDSLVHVYNTGNLGTDLDKSNCEEYLEAAEDYSEIVTTSQEAYSDMTNHQATLESLNTQLQSDAVEYNNNADEIAQIEVQLDDPSLSSADRSTLQSRLSELTERQRVLRDEMSQLNDSIDSETDAFKEANQSYNTYNELAEYYKDYLNSFFAEDNFYTYQRAHCYILPFTGNEPQNTTVVDEYKYTINGEEDGTAYNVVAPDSIINNGYSSTIGFKLNSSINKGDVLKVSLGTTNTSAGNRPFEVTINKTAVGGNNNEFVAFAEWRQDNGYENLYIEFSQDVLNPDIRIAVSDKFSAPIDYPLIEFVDTMLASAGQTIASNSQTTTLDYIDTPNMSTSNELLVDEWSINQEKIGNFSSGKCNLQAWPVSTYNLVLKDTAMNNPHKTYNADWHYYITGAVTTHGNWILSPDDVLLTNKKTEFSCNNGDTIMMSDILKSGTSNDVAIISAGGGYQLTIASQYKKDHTVLQGVCGTSVDTICLDKISSIDATYEHSGDTATTTYPLKRTGTQGVVLNLSTIYSRFFKSYSAGSGWKTANTNPLYLTCREIDVGKTYEETTLKDQYYYATNDATNRGVDWTGPVKVKKPLNYNTLSSSDRDYTSLDDVIEVEVPNAGDYNMGEAPFIADSSYSTGAKYIGSAGSGSYSMDTTYWLKKKVIVFPFDVYAYKNPNKPVKITSKSDANELVYYQAGTEIPLGWYIDIATTNDDGSYPSSAGVDVDSVVNDAYNGSEGSAVGAEDNACHFFDFGINNPDGNNSLGSGGGEKWHYYFYVPLSVGERKNEEILVYEESITESNTGNEKPDNLSVPERPNVYGDAERTFYTDIVGHMGALTMVDTGDFRWQDTFKVGSNDWTVYGLIKKLGNYSNREADGTTYASQKFIVQDPWDVRGRLSNITKDSLTGSLQNLLNSSGYKTYAYTNRGNNTYGSQWFKGVKTNWYNAYWALPLKSNGQRKQLTSESLANTNVNVQTAALPLSSEMNEHDTLKTTPLRLGYAQYLSLESIGNYYGTSARVSDATEEDDDYEGNVNVNGDMGQYKVQIRPVYFDISVDSTGAAKSTPVDAYMLNSDGKYTLLNANLYGNNANAVPAFTNNPYYMYIDNNDDRNAYTDQTTNDLGSTSPSSDTDDLDGYVAGESSALNNIIGEDQAYELNQLMKRKLVTELESRITFDTTKSINQTKFKRYSNYHKKNATSSGSVYERIKSLVTLDGIWSIGTATALDPATGLPYTYTYNTWPVTITYNGQTWTFINGEKKKLMKKRDEIRADYMARHSLNELGFETNMLMYYDDASTNTYTIGNAQYLFLRARTRTYVGGSSVYLYERDTVGLKKGKIKNSRKLGYSNAKHVYSSASGESGQAQNGRYPSRENEKDYPSEYPATHMHAQKWYFSLSLPSSTVFVPAGKAPTRDNIIKSIDGNKHYILTTIQVFNTGDVWTIQYKSPVSKLAVNVLDPNGTIRTVSSDIWNPKSIARGKYDEWLIPVSYYDPNTSSAADLTTTGTH